MREKILYALGAIGGIWLLRNLYVMLLGLPDESAQGAIYRIIFFHVPSWFTCFTGFFLAGISSILFLVKKKPVYDTFAVANVEVGLAFTIIGLITGMIWGPHHLGHLVDVGRAPHLGLYHVPDLRGLPHDAQRH